MVEWYVASHVIQAPPWTTHHTHTSNSNLTSTTGPILGSSSTCIPAMVWAVAGGRGGFVVSNFGRTIESWPLSDQLSLPSQWFSGMALSLPSLSMLDFSTSGGNISRRSARGPFLSGHPRSSFSDGRFSWPLPGVFIVGSAGRGAVVRSAVTEEQTPSSMRDDAKMSYDSPPPSKDVLVVGASGGVGMFYALSLGVRLSAFP